MLRRVPILAALGVLTAAGCGPRTPQVAQVEWASVDVNDDKAYPLGRYGALQHTLRVASSEGRTLRIRGRIHNPYPNSVDGVVVVVQILASGPPEGRELERHQIKLTEVTLSGDDETALGRDIQTMYTTNKFIRVAAFAMKRDGVELPPPPADLRETSVVQLSVAGALIPNSMAGNIFSGF